MIVGHCFSVSHSFFNKLVLRGVVLWQSQRFLLSMKEEKLPCPRQLVEIRTVSCLKREQEERGRKVHKKTTETVKYALIVGGEEKHCQLFPCPLLARAGKIIEFRHGKEENHEMVRKQNLVGNLPFVCSPTTIIIYQPCPSLPRLRGTLEETGAEPMMTVHFLPRFWLSVHVILCVCVCVYGLNLPKSKYLQPDVSAPIQTQTPPGGHCLVYHMEITLRFLSTFFIKPRWFCSWVFCSVFVCFLPHSPEEGVLNFRFMNSLELLCVRAFFS